MEEEPPEQEGIHLWLEHAQFPDNLKKYDFYSQFEDLMLMSIRYWAQRYQIWELYDQGIWMTEDAWYGVTPEPIAK